MVVEAQQKNRSAILLSVLAGVSVSIVIRVCLCSAFMCFPERNGAKTDLARTKMAGNHPTRPAEDDGGYHDILVLSC